ncbi:MAG: NADP-dependent malic enzyme [Oscillospiraceae bacterium]|nr:NADP-dependent malic enzyme [Oscillospiraceae bacterium]
MDIMEQALAAHQEWGGKLDIRSKIAIKDKEALSIAYTPGVAQPCLEIQKNPSLSYDLTGRNNLVAVITDGTAVLGLGDIGPLAAMPVMEGKCALFSEFGGVDAIPLCVDSKDPDEFCKTVALISGSFGGINLEDISAPRCFEIERKLKTMVDIPVFHDDQHGTAVVASAAIMNAAKLAGKELGSLKVVINGAGAAGVAIAEMLLSIGVQDILMLNSKGIVCAGDPLSSEALASLAQRTNKEKIHGKLADAMKGADVFIGVSKPNLVTPEMIRSMNEKPFIFAMANPTPEIMPDLAKEAGAFVIGTGRSDFPNQINNVLAFPGIFKGALSVRASDITEGMKHAAAEAIASCVSDEDLSPDCVIPNPFDPKVAQTVAEAVAAAAIKDGVARICSES